jgi:hypothetical protein
MEMTDSQLIQSVLKMQEELVSALAEVSRLTADMAQQSQPSTGKPFFTTCEEEREQVMRFLFNLQKSGITNMMAADDFIQKRFGFVKAKCQEYLFDYIDNYTELEALYSKPKAEAVESVVATIVPKKRKGPKPYSEMTPEEVAEVKAKKAMRQESKGTIYPVETTEPATVVKTKITLKSKKLAKPSGEETKPKGVLIWNAFMNTVKAEMMKVSGDNAEPSYNDVLKKAQEEKEAEPESYRLFAENWSN